MRFLALTLLLAAPLAAQERTDAERLRDAAATVHLAVLTLDSAGIPEKDRAGIDLGHLSDVLRDVASDEIPGLAVMTTQTVHDLLQASGLDPEKCEGLCAVDIGTKVSADFISEGKLARAGDGFRISVQLWEVGSKRRLKGFEVESATDAGLANGIRKNGKAFFQPLRDLIESRVADQKRAERRKLDEEQQKRLAEARVRAEERQKAEAAERERQRFAQELRRKEVRAELDAQPRTRVLRWVGWGLMGGAVAGGLVATYSVLEGKSRIDEIKNGESAYLNDVYDQMTKIAGSNQRARIAGGVGGALFVTGAILLLTQHPLDEDEVKSRELQLAAGPSQVFVAGRF